MADRLDDLSKRFDVSASKLQLLGNVASQEGASLEDVSSALKFLGKNAQIAADLHALDGVHPLRDGYGLMAERVAAWPAWRKLLDS